MELKPYQQSVLSSLEDYLQYLQQYKGIATAFNQYWEDKIGPYNPLDGTGMKPYQDTVPGAVHLCVKVPTAGGKTFIACNALHTIFSAYDINRPKAVVWLVPWSNLLDQTVNTLTNPQHPYRQRLNTLFNGRVEVYQKKDLLQGNNFNPTAVAGQLSIFVLSFASLRARNKEDRKIFQENGQLAAFTDAAGIAPNVLKDTDETALINIIRALHPVVIVDESHNAESPLSTDMLQSLSPSFILDLTATPGAKSNIVAFASALELKKEHMVKLPVIVYNHHDKNEVVSSALHLQAKLEALARQEQAEGGKYIRPIVLFQAQPKTGEEATTFTKLKEQLISLGIPEAYIKIKTAQIDELKGINLMSPDCEVRYIITINALKEGWDCPFAYILASLADKSSETDVTQILGRVLRQPYVMEHKNYQLNLSYVLTASAKFSATLQNIVEGLQAAGFSKQDYRAEDKISIAAAPPEPQDPVKAFLFPEKQQQATSATIADNDEIDPAKISYNPAAATEGQAQDAVTDIEALARATSEAFTAAIQQSESPDTGNLIPEELSQQVKSYKMRPAVAAIAKQIKLPRFYFRVPNANKLFHDTEWVLLNQESLLKGFKLSTKSSDINFDAQQAELYAVDLEEVRKGDYTPKFIPVDNAAVKDPLIEYILARPPQERIANIAEMMTRLIGELWPIQEQEIRKYVERIVADMSTDQLQDFLARKYSYSTAIKKKIATLSDEYAEEQFRKGLQVRNIKLEHDFQLPAAIVPGRLGVEISGSLYEREGDMSEFESRIISGIAGLNSVAFWHRNLGRGKGFAINGFKSNHYPDFLVVTKSGTIILLETKGSYLDNPDTAAKIRLGAEWAQKAGDNYRYFMVYEGTAIPGGYSVEEVKEFVRQL